MNLRLLEDPLERQKEQLRILLVTLRRASSIYDKIEVLNVLPEVDAYFSFPSHLKTFLSGLSLECEYVIKEVFAIGQGRRLFERVEEDSIHRFRPLLEDLLALESFYQDLGGIIGYQHLVLTLLTTENISGENETLNPPEGTDLSQDCLEVRKAVIQGIKDQGKMGELYPVGGAADRLQLKDDKTEEGLPAARLIFLGKPLLEGVICDLQAREYLHYKLFGNQVITPIGMMTSLVHRNHEHIRSICIQNKWFGRPKSSFKFFKQPSVPTFTKKGEWCLQKPLKLLLKPGGHGMLWKLLKQEGVFEWFDSLGVSKALVRQINNPMASIDHGLLAFLGIGHQQDKAFGFASCSRLVNAQEGMNVVKEINGKKVLTNIEYCDFEKCGIQDKPTEPGGKYSRFPSNTNILFADLKAVREAAIKHPNPGLLVNFRKGHHYHAAEEKEEIARLETTMQNIADAFSVEKEAPLPTYLTFNERRKTISTTKRKSTIKGKMLETPEGCYYDYMLNAEELLKAHCQMELPSFPDEKTFIKEGPSFLFSYHPALGPHYSIIGQKVRGGKLENGSELQLEIADLELENLSLDGSLLIHATDPVGHIEKGILNYSNQTGRCHLKNICVKNGGIDWEEDHLFWKHEVKRVAALKIVLHGHSEFFAENITINGDLTLEVPHGMRMRAEEKSGRVIFITEPLEHSGPFWTYSIDSHERIHLKKN
ncbi:MAG: UTP--glucose-1-phosphate uridylyltransferase [Simkaniaceae bacterium]|nr:MAG: UTP--glucose-1-phosphate uridylyltransferase [Simkaniaceae bacterium]